VDCGAPGSEITCRAEDALKRNRKNSVKGVKLSNECTCSEFKREVIRRTYPKQIKNRFKFGKYAFFFKKKAQEPMELQFQNNMEKAYEKGKAGNEARTDRMED